MVEGAELEKKKKEFHDASIEIIRLIDIGNIEDAQKLYNLYTNLYYQLLPALKEDEVSEYYQNLSHLYAKLQPFLVSDEEVSGESTLNKTDIDILYDLIQNKGTVSLTEVQKKFKIDKNKAEEWATILETSGLIKIKYAFLKGAILEKIK